MAHDFTRQLKELQELAYQQSMKMQAQQDYLDSQRKMMEEQQRLNNYPMYVAGSGSMLSPVGSPLTGPTSISYTTTASYGPGVVISSGSGGWVDTQAPQEHPKEHIEVMWIDLDEVNKDD